MRGVAMRAVRSADYISFRYNGPVVAPSTDQKEQALARDLVEVPAEARRLYVRGGFEGLEPNTLQVAVAIWLQPGQTVGELVELLSLGQGTVSTALARLSERGLVTTRPDKADARRQRQALTRLGRVFVERFVVHTADRLAEDQDTHGASSLVHARSPTSAVRRASVVSRSRRH